MASKDQSSSKQGTRSGSQQSDTSKRGFASMDPEQQREIASEGGRAAHQKGTAHEFTPEEARRAGSMSHKNDGNRQSSSASSGSRSRSSGNRASADEEDEDLEDDLESGRSQQGSRSGGSDV